MFASITAPEATVDPVDPPQGRRFAGPGGIVTRSASRRSPMTDSQGGVVLPENGPPSELAHSDTGASVTRDQFALVARSTSVVSSRATVSRSRSGSTWYRWMTPFRSDRMKRAMTRVSNWRSSPCR